MNGISPPPLRKMEWGANALSAPTTPDKRQVVVDRSKVDPQTLEAAEQYEAMFLDYMMKVMRETVPKNEMDLENTGTEVYRSMMDSETAQKAARAGGVGLADQIVAYLETNRYNSMEGPKTLQQSHGTENSQESMKDSVKGEAGTSVQKSVNTGSTRRYP